MTDPTAGNYSPSRQLADRDLRLPIGYRVARWSAAALVCMGTGLAAWWLVHAGVLDWFAGLFWHYLSWLPFVD